MEARSAAVDKHAGDCDADAGGRAKSATVDALGAAGVDRRAAVRALSATVGRAGENADGAAPIDAGDAAATAVGGQAEGGAASARGAGTRAAPAIGPSWRGTDRAEHAVGAPSPRAGRAAAAAAAPS